MSCFQMHTAPWIVPVGGPVIMDGGVVVEQGRIVAVDQRPVLERQFPEAVVVEHPGSALTPALTNAHIHLELSHLAELAAKPFATTFTGWIVQLLYLRDNLGVTGELVEEAARQVAQQQYQQGVGVLLDIGNTPVAQQLISEFQGHLYPHKEYLGLAAFTLEKNLQRLYDEPDWVRCSAHAPYSTHPQLIKALKKRACSLNHVFPIHVAEPVAEGHMLAEGRGEMVDFVRTRGFWDGSFQPPGQSGSIRYLNKLDVLDERTLCVHAVHLDDEEIRMIAGEGAHVCLCPGSNQFLQVGTAPLQQFLEAGILPALGTDSAASNPELSLWREMALLAQIHPQVDPEHIFAMATKGGAQALGLGQTMGTLEPGKRADILVVPVSASLQTAQQLMRYLVTVEKNGEPDRVFY